MAPLFPFADYWWLYATFTALMFVLLALDLGVFHRKAHAPGFREAALWTGVWVALAVISHKFSEGASSRPMWVRGAVISTI